jgi:hypothetical protein
MSDPEEDLRSTAESIRHDARQVQDLESQKIALDPADPKIVQLSHQVEQIAAGLRDKAVAERELSEEIQAAEQA